MKKVVMVIALILALGLGANAVVSAPPDSGKAPIQQQNGIDRPMPPQPGGPDMGPFMPRRHMEEPDMGMKIMFFFKALAGVIIFSFVGSCVFWLTYKWIVVGKAVPVKKGKK